MADSGPKVVRIVLTGAPASGKSDILERLKGCPEFAGFVFLEEVARRLLEADPESRRDWRAFHNRVYRRQIEELKAMGDVSFISDRGTADAFAFHPETMVDVGTSLETEYARYTDVIHLESSANLGENYCLRDEIRYESIERILDVEKELKTVWRGHPGYHFVSAEKAYERKICNVLALIRELTGLK
jgi:predicted ATPase